MRCYEVLWGVMGCYEQPAITAITPVMAAPITLSGDKCRASRTGTPIRDRVQRTEEKETAHMNAKAKTRPYHFRHSILFKLRTD